MKKYLFAVFISFIFLYCRVYSQELIKIDEVDLSAMHASGKFKFESTEIFTSKKVLLGNYSSYHLGAIVAEILNKHNITDKNNVIIIIDDSSGKTTTADIFSFDMESAVIPAFIAFEKVKARKMDTIAIADQEGKFLVPDYKGIDEALKAGATKRIYTPILKISKDEIARLFKGFTIVFPEDKTTKRWITNAIRIRLYYLKQ